MEGTDPVASSIPVENVLMWTSGNFPPNTNVRIQVRAINGFGEGTLSESQDIMTRFGGML